MNGEPSRTVRAGATARQEISDILHSAFLAELADPSDELWIVSPWVSDIPILDNGWGGIEAFFAEAPRRQVTLAELAARLTQQRTRLSLVTRPAQHNEKFIARLCDLGHRPRISLVRDDDVHEKSLVGDDWVVTGSMNFTFNGLWQYDEQVTYTQSAQLAAEARLTYRHRWGGAS